MTSSEPEPPEERAGADAETGHGIDPETTHPDIAGFGYERARDELADVVRRLEAGGLSLEESLALWERGEALAAVCERHLAGARQRVDQALAAVEQQDESNDNGG